MQGPAPNKVIRYPKAFLAETHPRERGREGGRKRDQIKDKSRDLTDLTPRTSVSPLLSTPKIAPTNKLANAASQEWVSCLFVYTPRWIAAVAKQVRSRVSRSSQS